MCLFVLGLIMSETKCFFNETKLHVFQGAWAQLINRRDHQNHHLIFLVWNNGVKRYQVETGIQQQQHDLDQDLCSNRGWSTGPAINSPAVRSLSAQGILSRRFVVIRGRYSNGLNLIAKNPNPIVWWIQLYKNQFKSYVIHIPWTHRYFALSSLGTRWLTCRLQAFIQFVHVPLNE